MNRTHHLKLTLPKNIKDNIEYGNVEFVVLNYNSKDDLDEWIKAEMKQYIHTGIIKYIKTTVPECFLMSHSKNVVAKYATGDVVCSIDADNFIGKGFAEYLNNEFQLNNNIFLTVKKFEVPSGCYGRICMLKKDFMTIKGYDENMLGYGHEDSDLRNRLELLGKTPRYMSASNFFNVLSHDDDERLKDEKNALGIQKIFISHIDQATTWLLYLFNDFTFYKGVIVSHRFVNSESIENLFEEEAFSRFGNSLLDDVWEVGHWEIKENRIVLINKQNSHTSFESFEENSFMIDNRIFIRVKDENYRTHLTMFFSIINNRILMEKNKKEKRIVVNTNAFGETIFEQNYI